MKSGITALGAVLVILGAVLTMLEYRNSPLPFVTVFLSGRDYIVRVIGLVLFIMGTCLDLVMPDTDSEDGAGQSE